MISSNLPRFAGMSGNLLVIIDPQLDFIGEGGFYHKRHEGITQIRDACANIQALLSSSLDLEIALVYSDYKAGQFGSSMCIPGTEGHKIGLQLTDRVPLIPKTEHSCFSSASFKGYLQDRKVERLILCGFLAEYCVRQTALDGLVEGYKVAVLAPCVGTGDDVQGAREATFRFLEERGVELLQKGTVVVSAADVF
jgi:nicotinamidase/pyrazinamidase